MVETAIYVLLGALTTALLALLALPAVSRRAFRLAQARARLLAPHSAAEALAERDALRGKHAVEVALVERAADAAQTRWAQAQIALGERAVEIVQRDDKLKQHAEEIARQRAELAALDAELSARDAEIGARELALRDFEGQRDAAQRRLAQTAAEGNQAKVESERTRVRLEREIEDLSHEMSLAQRRFDSAALAAKAAAADVERRLEEREGEALRLRRQATELTLRTPAFPRAPAENASPGDRLAEATLREADLVARLRALSAAQGEAEAAARAARAERDLALRELERERARLPSGEAAAEADAALRQAIARLGRDMVATRAASLADARREPVS